MVPVATLLAVAASWWAGVAPGVAEQNCPDGVRYNVRPAAQMATPGRQVVAEALLGGCVITFKAGRLATYTPVGACVVVLHEYGHAALGLAAGGPDADVEGHAPAGLMSAWMDVRPPGVCFRLDRVAYPPPREL